MVECGQGGVIMKTYVKSFAGAHPTPEKLEKQINEFIQQENATIINVSLSFHPVNKYTMALVAYSKD